jgi:hypothetical protein
LSLIVFQISSKTWRWSGEGLGRGPVAVGTWLGVAVSVGGGGKVGDSLGGIVAGSSDGGDEVSAVNNRAGSASVAVGSAWRSSPPAEHARDAAVKPPKINSKMRLFINNTRFFRENLRRLTKIRVKPALRFNIPRL